MLRTLFKSVVRSLPEVLKGVRFIYGSADKEVDILTISLKMAKGFQRRCDYDEGEHPAAFDKTPKTHFGQADLQQI